VPKECQLPAVLAGDTGAGTPAAQDDAALVDSGP
jgi:hypothetical protein